MRNSLLIGRNAAYSPGEWFAELKTDMTRAYVAIALLLRIGDLVAPAATPVAVPSVDAASDPNAVH